jgi:hypothetical protein
MSAPPTTQRPTWRLLGPLHPITPAELRRAHDESRESSGATARIYLGRALDEAARQTGHNTRGRHGNQIYNDRDISWRATRLQGAPAILAHLCVGDAITTLIFLKTA